MRKGVLKREVASLGFSCACSHVLGRERETCQRLRLAPALRNVRLVTQAPAQSAKAAMDDAEEGILQSEGEEQNPSSTPRGADTMLHAQTPLDESAHSH